MLFSVLFLLLGCRETLSAKGDPRRAIPAWSRTLEQIVTEDGLVDYDLLEANRESLDDYVAWIERADALKGKKKADHHAFWLNAFNALVLFQVLERGRPASVRDVDGFFVWTQFPIGWDHISLSEIEHERIRMRELNYRDHAAMNHGTMSSAPLRNELYVKPRLREQLTGDIERWLTDPIRGVKIDAGTAVFPAEFQWYRFDFEFTSGGDDPCTVAARHVGAPLRGQLHELARVGCPHRFQDYDWRLNDASSSPQ